MSKLSLVILVALGCACSSAHAMYPASGPVIDLTASNFEAKVKTAGLMLVEVRCG